MNIMLKYSFIFNPEDTWRNRLAFDRSLADIFKSNGFNAVEVETGVQEDDFREKVIILSPIPQDDIIDKNEELVSNKKLKATLIQKRGFDGTFKKVNE